MTNPWPVARAALRRRPWTAVATALLVALAVALGVAVGAVERAVREGSIRAVAGFDLILGAPGSPTTLVLAGVFLRPEAIPLLPGEALARLQGVPGIAWFSPIGFGDSWRGHPVVGVAPAFVTRGGRRPLAEGSVFAEHFQAVLGAEVPLAIGQDFTPGHGRFADPDAGERGHEHSAYRVVGRLPRLGTAWDRAILVPIESVWELHGMGDGRREGEAERVGPPWSDPAGVPAVVVAPLAVADAYRLRQAWRTDTSLAVFPAEVLVPLLRTLGDVRGLLASVAWAGFALVLAAVFLALSAGFAVRARDFAALRAIGAPRSFVAGAAWLEASVLVGAGVVLGLPLGWALAAVLAGTAAGSLAFEVTPAPDWPDALAPLLALAAGLLAGLVPAVAMARRPIEADLRR